MKKTAPHPYVPGLYGSCLTCGYHITNAAHRTRKRVILLVGLPGSGKSTYVDVIRAVDDPYALVCSTDAFFMVDHVYTFDPFKLVEYHARNFQDFALALARGTPTVVVDNTNLMRAHRAPYIEIARALGYIVELHVIGGFDYAARQTYSGRNVHGVPITTLDRMAANYEPPTEDEGIIG